MSQIRSLMHRATGGKRSNINAHIRRLEIISEMIGNPNPWTWKAKNLRSVLAIKTEKSIATGYDYWLAIRRIATMMDKWSNWEPHLRGPWATDEKQPRGRPAKLPHNPQAKRHNLA